jgi:hypothetical protein
VHAVAGFAQLVREGMQALVEPERVVEEQYF